MRLFPSLLLAVVLTSPYAQAAAVFTITNRTVDATIKGTAVETALNAAADAIENDINNVILTDDRRSTLETAMAGANAGATTDLAVDRASNPGKTSVTIGAQLGCSDCTSLAGKSSASNGVPSAGISAQSSVAIGINAGSLGLKSGFVDPKRLTVYINGGYYSTTLSGIRISMLNFGTHGTYKLVERKGNSIFGWGGLDLTSGFGYSSLAATYAASLAQTEGSGAAALSLSMNYDLGIKATNYTIPLELSTNVNFLYLFTFFLGGGVDLNFGKTTFTGGGTGPITQTTAGVTTFSGTAVLNMEVDPTAGPGFAVGRGFGGIQVNLGMIKYFLQGSYYSNKTIGAATGFRVAF